MLNVSLIDTKSYSFWGSSIAILCWMLSQNASQNAFHHFFAHDHKIIRLYIITQRLYIITIIRLHDYIRSPTSREPHKTSPFVTGENHRYLDKRSQHDSGKIQIMKPKNFCGKTKNDLLLNIFAENRKNISLKRKNFIVFCNANIFALKKRKNC